MAVKRIFLSFLTHLKGISQFQIQRDSISVLISFDATSKILKKAKFMIDLSFLPNDGGGTQYTFLDAIFQNCAIILNRQWIENVDIGILKRERTAMLFQMQKN